MGKLEEIERLSHGKKVLHWAQAKPWDGLRLQNQTAFEAREVRMDDSGHITDQPTLIGKPCFGQPIVYVRQGQTMKRFDRNGVLRLTRCGRCLVREACHMVCQLRLKVDGAIEATYREFLGQGGVPALGEKHLKSRCQAIFDRLVKQLIQHGPFNSVNDARVLLHYDRERERQKILDAERKREERIKRLVSGALDQAAIELLGRHRHYRSFLLRSLLESGATLPRRLAKIPETSIEVTADAWFAREVLKHTKQKINASSVAREMIRTKPDRYAKYESLRQRTPADLDRIDLLERLMLPGAKGPVWPPFDLLHEIKEEENLHPTEF
jgi:hypothetical protein